MKKSDFEYELPERLIAQSPPQHRKDARLMVVDRAAQTIEHKAFSDFLTYLSPSDLLVFNNTKVIPARFFGQKASGGQVEILLERMTSEVTALAQIRASKAPKPGAIITLAILATRPFGYQAGLGAFLRLNSQRRVFVRLLRPKARFRCRLTLSVRQKGLMPVGIRPFLRKVKARWRHPPLVCILTSRCLRQLMNWALIARC